MLVSSVTLNGNVGDGEGVGRGVGEGEGEGVTFTDGWAAGDDVGVAVGDVGIVVGVAVAVG